MRPAPIALAGPWHWSDGQVEALKWLGLAAMLLDHVGRFALGHGTRGWVFAGGRLAFPLFALALALNLARPGDQPARTARTARRLALWCVIAIGPSVLMRGDPRTANVLATLGLGTLVCWLFAASAGPAASLAALATVALAAPHVEFGLAGILLVPTLYLWHGGRAREALPLALLLLAVVARSNASSGGALALATTLAAAPLALVVRALPLHLPRTGHAFYPAYVLHQALVAAWRFVS
jgi:hypothetical protein